MAVSRRSFLQISALLAFSPSVHACTWGTPVWHPEPVLEPTEAWEGSCAMPFSDGCWWDEDRQRYRLWYMAGYGGGTALAESRDGYHWEKRGIVDERLRDSSTIWQLEDGSYVRATYFQDAYATKAGLTLQRSPDGRRWTTTGMTPPLGDRSTIFRGTDGRWFLSARDSLTAARGRRIYVADEFEGPYAIAGPIFEAWPADDPDALNTQPQLYNLDARAFSTGYLGLAAIWGGDRYTAPKRNNLAVFTSPDGISWDRGPRQWITEGAPGSWREGNIQSCGGLFVELPDGKLGFYVSARSGPVGPVNKQRCVTGLVTIARNEVCVA